MKKVFLFCAVLVVLGLIVYGTFFRSEGISRADAAKEQEVTIPPQDFNGFEQHSRQAGKQYGTVVIKGRLY